MGCTQDSSNALSKEKMKKIECHQEQDTLELAANSYSWICKGGQTDHISGQVIGNCDMKKSGHSSSLSFPKKEKLISKKK